MVFFNRNPISGKLFTVGVLIAFVSFSDSISAVFDPERASMLMVLRVKGYGLSANDILRFCSQTCLCFGVLSSLSTPAASTGRPPPDHEQKMRDADRQLEMILQGGVLWSQRSNEGLSPCLSLGVKARMPSLNSVESETAPISSYFWNQCESSDVAGCLNRRLMWCLWSSDLVLRRTSLVNDSGVSGYLRRRFRPSWRHRPSSCCFFARDLVIQFTVLVSSCSRYQSVTGAPPLQSGISGSSETGRRICLSGNSNLSEIYFFSFVIYTSIAIDWIYILYNERMSVFGIHIFTLAVFILKAPNLLCETEDKPYVKKTGMRDVLFMIQYDALVRKISVGEVKLGLAGLFWLWFLYSTSSPRWRLMGSADNGKMNYSISVSPTVNSSGCWNSHIQRPLYRVILRSFLCCSLKTSIKNVSQVFSVLVSYIEPWLSSIEHFKELEADVRSSINTPPEVVSPFCVAFAVIWMFEPWGSYSIIGFGDTIVPRSLVDVLLLAGNFSRWRKMFGIAIISSILLALGMAYSPESPWWLYQQGRISKAEFSIKRLFGKEKVVEVMDGSSASGQGSTEPEAGWLDLLSGWYLRVVSIHAALFWFHLRAWFVLLRFQSANTGSSHCQSSADCVRPISYWGVWWISSSSGYSELQLDLMPSVIVAASILNVTFIVPNLDQKLFRNDSICREIDASKIHTIYSSWYGIAFMGIVKQAVCVIIVVALSDYGLLAANCEEPKAIVNMCAQGWDDVVQEGMFEYYQGCVETVDLAALHAYSQGHLGETLPWYKSFEAVNNGCLGMMNPGSRQVYLTFPADSAFRKEDTSIRRYRYLRVAIMNAALFSGCLLAFSGPLLAVLAEFGLPA